MPVQRACAWVRGCSDITVIETGIGDTLSICIQFTAAFPTGLIISVIYSWELALMILASAPVFGAISAFVVWVSLV